jgi:hypothetical protein
MGRNIFNGHRLVYPVQPPVNGLAFWIAISPMTVSVVSCLKHLALQTSGVQPCDKNMRTCCGWLKLTFDWVETDVTLEVMDSAHKVRSG